MPETPDAPLHELILLRHAKSSWKDRDRPDHDRPLAPRGERAVRAMRDRLRGDPIVRRIDLVLCSSARRTRATLEGLALELDPGALVSVEEALYHADPGSLLARLRSLGELATPPRAVLLIGHNPGLEELAGALVGSGDRRTRRRMAAKFPTAALATLALDRPWDRVGSGCAHLVGYVRPRDLEVAAPDDRSTDL